MLGPGARLLDPWGLPAFVLSGAGKELTQGLWLCFHLWKRKDSVLLSLALILLSRCQAEVVGRCCLGSSGNAVEKACLKIPTQMSLPTTCHTFLNVSVHFGTCLSVTGVSGHVRIFVDIFGSAWMSLGLLGWHLAGSPAPGGACITIHCSALAKMFSRGAND